MLDTTTENEPGRTVLFLNGPNLNLLGAREPDQYGSTTLREAEETVTKTLSTHGLAARFVQSNHEGVLIDTIHAARTECGAIVINPAAFTHTSVALRDAIAAVALPTVELHITNVHRREEFRHHSYVSAVADTVIIGAGTRGYVLAALHVAHLLLGWLTPRMKLCSRQKPPRGSARPAVRSLQPPVHLGLSVPGEQLL